MNNQISFFSHFSPQRSTITRIIGVLALVVTPLANAYVYTLDEASSIVTGTDGLEWLQWDETIGLSIDDVLAAGGYAETIKGGGWRLATNVEVSGLFNSYAFGKTFDSNPISSESSEIASPAVDSITDGAHGEFVYTFGDTYSATIREPCWRNVYACYSASYAAFGDEAFDVNLAVVRDNYIERRNNTERDYTALHADYYLSDYSSSNVGVALVRAANSISAPTSLFLFTVALLGLFRRPKQDIPL